MGNWKKILLGIAGVLIVFTLVGNVSHHHRSVAKSSTSETNKSVPSGYVKIPETAFKPKEQVADEFKQAGLTPKFKIEDLSAMADANNQTVYKDNCGKVGEQENRKYLDFDEYGDKYGMYAKKGSTIYVGYSDKDISPKSIDKSSSSSNHTTTESTTTEKKGVSKEAFASLLEGYDKLNSEVKRVDKQVDSMTKTEKQNASIDLLQLQNEVMDKQEGMSKDLSLSQQTQLTNKSIDVMQSYDSLSKKLKESK